MGHHNELESKEVLRFAVCVLLRLVDFSPNLLQVLVDHGLDCVELDAAVVVTQDEQQLLGRVLVKEFQVHLEDHL